jgi:LemA protein
MFFSVLSLIVGLVVLAAFLYAIILFNGFIQLKFNIEKAWANIDVLLKQRHDEVPNLIACVKGAANFEQGVMEKVTLARAGAEGARGVGEKAKAEAALSAAVGSLFLVAENYPELKATENFLALQKRLSSLENQVADRREFYNDSVANYNIRIQQFPDLLLAKLFHFHPKEMFSVSSEEKRVIQVQFGAGAS